ncbi:sulfate adenylyltransferase [Caminibacter pacificus]|uniref:Sulfate adenylyltransferase n=1 Tax=Caminibacter pacificus TaxID=1424653 RepID=A0AAJ4RDK1_9BACT|nr:sulfate adenylyltransferase [Caminibacter pacificus]QCI28605.1 sulfate adenylyltransferase [Caminibacter pacificus]ROR40666.1 sulfate adenylyltransferase [Caminibacter pacificus]
MESSNKNKIFIDKEAYYTLAMVQAGLLNPIDKLMNSKEAKIADTEKKYKGKSVPFSFILAPAGKRNEEVLKQNPQKIELYYNNKKIGEVNVEEIYEIDPLKRVETIYGTKDTKNYPQVARTLKRLGKYAIAGDFWVEDYGIKKKIDYARELIKNKEKVVGMTMHAKPIHRVHEKIMRQAIEKNDLLIIFLIKNIQEDEVPYKLRFESLKFVVENYFPKDKIIIIPLLNTYIFSGVNEAILDAMMAKNFGCTKFIMGQTHKGLGIYYEADHLKSIFDSMDIGIEIETINEYVYCDKCKTIVSVNSCPHGSHHHISYHSDSIFELIKTGLMPPTILMRKEISAKFLAHMFPNRFKNLQKLYYDIAPNKGLIEENKEEDFYIALMKLYQTSSLT